MPMLLVSQTQNQTIGESNLSRAEITLMQIFEVISIFLSIRRMRYMKSAQHFWQIMTIVTKINFHVNKSIPILKHNIFQALLTNLAPLFPPCHKNV